MRDEPETSPNQGQSARQPIFLLPPVVTGMIAVMVLIHAVRVLILNSAADAQLVYWLAFVPLRLTAADHFAGGWLPLLWTPFTHALLHGGWEHLLVNMAWLMIFGTPVARRYGTAATLMLFFFSAVAGAALFAVTTIGSPDVLLGASGGIAGLTGAACRFIFQPVITAENPETGELSVLGRRTARLGELVRDGRAMFFIGIWVVLNAAVPLLPLLMGQGIEIAWQSHLAGFFCGLLMTPLFDRRPADHAA
jgi:membrane associated rhomboid family serine protease